MNSLPPGCPVNHASFGRGVVEYSKGETTLVRFSRGIEECLTRELTYLRSAAESYLQGQPAHASTVAFEQSCPSLHRFGVIQMKSGNAPGAASAPNRVNGTTFEHLDGSFTMSSK